MPRHQYQIARLLQAVLAIAVVVSLPPSVSAQLPEARPPSLPSDRVDLNGVELRIVTAGFGARESGEPAVVFESGLGSPVWAWDHVLPSVAEFTELLAYDRPGFGESGWDEVSPTPDVTVARLRALLTELRIDPPFVVVGHSWGGALIRYFAGTYPDEVAGLVYVDPTDITMTREENVSVYLSAGGNIEDFEAGERMQDSINAEMPGPLRAESSVVTDLMRRGLEDRGIPPAPDVPTSVLVAGRTSPVPEGVDLPDYWEVFANRLRQFRAERVADWSRDPGTFQVANDSGHFIQIDQPELVIEEIRRLVER